MRWRMVTGVLFIATLVAGMATCAKAASMKGNQLLQYCTTTTEHRIICIGYVLGFVDATVFWMVNASGISICIPSEDVTIDQIADVVVKWLKAHPQDLKQAAGFLVATILEETWPCRESGHPSATHASLSRTR
jgi:Rap1a immunity proteins